jgi:hypothetical protein
VSSTLLTPPPDALVDRVPPEAALVRAALAFPTNRTVRGRLLNWLEANSKGDQADVLRLRWTIPALPEDAVRSGPLTRWNNRLSRAWDRYGAVCGDLVLTPGQAVYLFRQLLMETVSWYGRAGADIRTPELEPAVVPTGRPEWERAFSAVTTTRARLLAQAGGAADDCCGQLLVYYPDAGSSCPSANGFLDRTGTPPWDSWVFLGNDSTEPEPAYRTHLVCWVPAGCLVEVDRAVESCPRASVQWAADADLPLTRALRDAELLG